MGYIISCLFILFLLSFLIFSGNKSLSKFDNSFLNSKVFASTSSKPAPSLITATLSKEEISERLKKLAKSKPPNKLFKGALCYEMALPPQRIEYVCSKCGEKTLYASDSPKGIFKMYYIIGGDIPEGRRLIKEIKIKGLNAEFCELEFCKKCSPKITSPQLWLIVKYPKEKMVHRVKGVTAEDLKLILEFLSEKDRHVGGQDGETPLKNYVLRLQELLGIKLDDGENK